MTAPAQPPGLVLCYIVPYSLGSNEHCIVPVQAANAWDKEHKIKEVFVTREEYDALCDKMDAWCQYQDRMDELLQ